MIHKRHLQAAMKELSETWDGSAAPEGICDDCLASFILSIQHDSAQSAAQMVGGIICGVTAQRIAEADEMTRKRNS